MAMKRRSVAQQKFGVRDQCVLDHEVPGGDVRPEYPYGLIDPAGAFQDPGLEVLRVAGFDTPPLSTAGAADPLSSRRDQLQNLLVTAPALRQLDESGQDPPTVQVRGE
ncbi:hypothetical protein [Streptomyces eurythermus]|uniref:hypothetical protein n=1 Tax=Streptomyces eurythermus TaxID=42237 RepID=UPI0036D3F6D7